MLFFMLPLFPTNKQTPGPSQLLTLSGQQVSADEGCVDVLQQDDALLGGHAQQVVQPVV